MDASGQVYADLDGDAPDEDVQRFLLAEREALHARDAARMLAALAAFEQQEADRGDR